MPKFVPGLLVIALLTLVGCGDKPKATTYDSSNDLKTAPPVVVQQPVQPVQPIQPIVSDNPAPVVTTTTPPITPAASASTYTVQKGDTLYKIARTKYGDPSAVKKIKEANPGLDPDKIKVGQKLAMP